VRLHYNCWVRRSPHARQARADVADPPPTPKPKAQPMIAYPSTIPAARNDLGSLLGRRPLTTTPQVYDIDDVPLHPFSPWEKRINGQF
jgi:hypothetical protein